MAIFNSLGSNYDFSNVIESFSANNSPVNKTLLTSFLEQKYGGKVTLLYKGREAIKLALRKIDQSRASVGICGYTCFAVYESVVTEDYDVVYLDINDTLNF